MNDMPFPPRTGYFSLVQYRPDEMRQEAATVGVLLYCPDWNCLEVRTTRALGRVKQFFKNDDFDTKRVRAMLDALEERVRVVRPKFHSLEDLRGFAALRGNAVVLTEPRATKIRDMRQDLDRLFARAVGLREPEAASPAIFSELRTIFEAAVESGRAERDVRIELPLGGKIFEAPYAYQNGFRNLVKPFAFSAVRGHALAQTEQLAFESNEVSKKLGPRGQKQKVLIVAKIAEDAKAELPWGEMRAILADYSARVEEAGALDSIKSELAGVAHGDE